MEFKHLKEWNEFIGESFEEKSVPHLLKKISSIVRKDIVKNGNNSFNKLYSIDGINFIIKVNYKFGNHQPYYSNVDIYSILTEPDKDVNISINVVDEDIDINYLMSIILHELRHIYDIYTVSNDVEMSDFLKTYGFNEFKNSEFSYFINLIYLSLEHELIARHNMLYELFRWIDITDKNKLYDIFKKSYTYVALNELKNFDHVKFIKQYDISQLFIFTKQFVNHIKNEFVINSENDLYPYYKKWEDFFIKKSNEFTLYIDTLLDDVIDDVVNDKVYERLSGYISYNEDIGNKVSTKIFEKMINEYGKL